jgi:hypothetical protein
LEYPEESFLDDFFGFATVMKDPVTNTQHNPRISIIEGG